MACRFGKDYEVFFEPSVYLKTYYSDIKLSSDDYYTTIMNHWHDIFINDGIKGGTLLDLGSGPNISNIMSGSKICSSIVMAEYAQVNRDAITDWLNNDPCAHDWSPFFKYVANNEGVSWQHVEQRVRTAIKDVIPCDVHEPNPLIDRVYQPFDVVLTSCCLENACQDRGTFRAVIRNVSRLVRDSGHLLIIGDLNKGYYMVGPEKFFSLKLDQNFVEDTVKDAGFEILQFQSHVTFGEFSDANGYFFMAAKKNIG